MKTKPFWIGSICFALFLFLMLLLMLCIPDFVAVGIPLVFVSTVIYAVFWNPKE